LGENVEGYKEAAIGKFQFNPSFPFIILYVTDERSRHTWPVVEAILLRNEVECPGEGCGEGGGGTAFRISLRILASLLPLHSSGPGKIERRGEGSHAGIHHPSVRKQDSGPVP
jgi:hypothetical protein